jgi:hypothetical protein
MQRPLPLLKLDQQFVGGLTHLFVVDLVPEATAPFDAFVDFVALAAHGRSAWLGGSAFGLSAPMPGFESAMGYNRRRGFWFLNQIRPLRKSK